MEPSIQIFMSEDFGEIRTLIIAGKIWFVAADVCRALNIKQATKALKRLKDDEKGVTTIHTTGGPQEMLIINEPGLYRLVLLSRKPEAEKFQDWVYTVVLPSIRQTGFYAINSFVNNFPPELSKRWADIKDRENLVKASEVLVKAARLTTDRTFRENLLRHAVTMITDADLAPKPSDEYYDDI